MTVLTALLFAGCRIGSQSVSSGLPDESYVCFFSPKKQNIQVNIDGQTYSMQTIKDKEWRNDRNIKKTSFFISIVFSITYQFTNHYSQITNPRRLQIYKKLGGLRTNQSKIIS